MQPSKGFTLPELLIVVLLAVILTTLAYPAYDRFVRDARIEKTKADLLATALQIDRYYAREHHFPTPDVFNHALTSETNTTELNLDALKHNHYFDVTLENNTNTTENERSESHQYVLIAQPSPLNNLHETRHLRLDSDGLFYICYNKGETSCEVR